jgi:hypothetical protein
MTSTMRVTRGAERLMIELGYAPLREVSLTNGRRVDLVGVNKRGEVMVVEVKSGTADFKSDGKWREYLEYCHCFYFAVDTDFPLSLLDEDGSLPDETGVIIADEFGGEIMRNAAPTKVNAARAKTLVLKMARTGAMRLAEVAAVR